MAKDATATYYYETHASNGPFRIEAHNDAEALEKLRVKYGESLAGVMILYVEEGLEDFRTVWME